MGAMVITRPTPSTAASCLIRMDRSLMPTRSVRALLRRGFGGFFLFAPRAGERVPHAVVALVARMLEDRPDRLRHRRFRRPRCRPRGRIVDGEAIAERVRVHASDSLDHLHLLA